METNKFNHLTIQQYLEGKLDDKAMHELEKQALEDPFLADALEGYANAQAPVGKQLSILQTQLQERIAQQQDNKNVFNFSWQRLSVATAACLLFVMASVLLIMRQQQSEKQLASSPKSVDVSLTPIDSISGRQASESAGTSDNKGPNTNASVEVTKPASKTPSSEMEPTKGDLNHSKSKGSSTVAVQSSDQVLAESADVNVGSTTAKSAKNEANDDALTSAQANTAPAVKPGASQPLIGWERYNTYLKDNIHKAASTVTGSVVLYFTIAKDGKPRDILVRKGLSPSADLEAMRLVKDGPLWQPKQDSTASITVHFGK